MGLGIMDLEGSWLFTVANFSPYAVLGFELSFLVFSQRFFDDILTTFLRLFCKKTGFFKFEQYSFEGSKTFWFLHFVLRCTCAQRPQEQPSPSRWKASFPPRLCSVFCAFAVCTARCRSGQISPSPPKNKKGDSPIGLYPKGQFLKTRHISKEVCRILRLRTQMQCLSGKLTSTYYHFAIAFLL